MVRLIEISQSLQYHGCAIDGIVFFFEMLIANKKIWNGTKMIPLSKFWLEHPMRRQYEGVVFAPGEEKQAIGLDGLRRWADLRDDIVALGGITASNARACLDAGAHGFAGIRAFFGPRAEARQDVVDDL